MNTSASCPKAWGRTGALAYAGSKPCVLTPAWQSGSSWRGRVSRNWIASGSRCETATRLPTGRVVGCGGVAFGCTSWPAFCLAAGAVRRWSPAPIQVPLIDRGPSSRLRQLRFLPLNLPVGCGSPAFLDHK